MTIQFLNAVLYDNEETQITDVCFLDKDQDPNFEHEKLSKLDILAQTNTGMLIDIEVQVLKHAYLSERFLYYWAGLYGSQLKEKDQYTQLKPTVSIILLDFDYLPETAWHNRYHICNDISKHTLTDQFAMHFIEIKKFTYSDIKKLTKLGTIVCLSYLFNTKNGHLYRCPFFFLIILSLKSTKILRITIPYYLSVYSLTALIIRCKPV